MRVSETPSIPPQRLGRGHYMALGAIILFGAMLRFVWLDHPVIWGDEGATFARTCGTFREMLEANRADGFVPLHYELYWLMGKCWPLTPWRLRLVPAIAGTLMIPAMYFLARQLLRPNASLLVALFTATSAYFLNYSRDAKMYMQTWLMIVLHMGFFLMWLRGGESFCRPFRAGPTGVSKPRACAYAAPWAEVCCPVRARGLQTGGHAPNRRDSRYAWWFWVIFGVAAVGLHASAWFIVPVTLLMLLTACRPTWKWVLYGVGIGIMAAGPLVYYRGYNIWAERSGLAEATTKSIAPTQGFRGIQPGWRASGISWIEPQTRDKTGPQLVRDSATAFFFGYSRAEEEPDANGDVPIPPAVLTAAWSILAGIILTLIAGAIRWPRKVTAGEVHQPWQSWQLFFWMGAWLVIPTYVFYCGTVVDALSPWQWVCGIVAFFYWHLAWAIAAMILVSWLAKRNRHILIIAAWALALAFVAIIALAVYCDRSQWYLALLRWSANLQFLLPMLILAAAVSSAVRGHDARVSVTSVDKTAGLEPRRPFIIPLASCAILLLFLCQGIWWGWEYYRRSTTHLPHAMWMPRYLAVIAPAVMIIFAIALMRLPGRLIPTILAIAFIGANLTQYAARLVLDPEPRADIVAADLLGAEKDRGYVVYVRDKMLWGAPGMGSVHDTVTRYFLALGLERTFTPAQIRHSPTASLLQRPLNRLYTLRSLTTAMQRNPAAHHLILWEKLSLPRTESPEAIAKALGSEWQLSNEWTQVVRRHWNWQDIDTIRRLVFVKVAASPAAATQATPNRR